MAPPFHYLQGMSSRRTTLVTRALRLRCPNCGGGGVLRHWLSPRSRCPHCHISLEVGNPVGANLLNLVTSEVILMLCLVAIIVRSRPDVPWTFLQFGAPLLMVLTPMLFFPFSKLLFIAFDLAMHPEGKPDALVHYEERIENPE